MIDNLVKVMIGLILIICFMPVIGTLVDYATATNMASFAFSNLMVLIIAMSGIFMLLMFLRDLFGNKDNGGFNP